MLVAGCLNSELRLEVTVDIAPAAPVTTTQALLCELARDLTGYTIDLASPLYPFGEAAGRLDGPYTVTLTDDSTGGSAVAMGRFGAAYTDSSGLDQTAGSGQPVDYEFDETSGRLVYAPSYQRFTGPGVAWEFGGIVLEQADGSAVDQGPAFSLAIEDGVGHLRWTLVTLQGTGEQAGTGQATALLRHSATRDHVLVAAAASFTLETPAAQAWRAYFEERVLLAGADGEADAGGDGETATLDLGGGSVTRWVVHLRLVTAGVEVL